MFNHSYAAAMLADQHRQDLQADAARSRLARQANTKPPRQNVAPRGDLNRRRTVWLVRRHRHQPTANPT
jgi:hypothetical protein